jgi:hypothetical protein
MERLPAYIFIEDNKYKSCIILTNYKDYHGTRAIRMPDRIEIYACISKNGYVYLKNSTPVFAYLKGWLYDCDHVLDPINIGTNNSAEQVTQLWEAMKCL